MNGTKKSGVQIHAHRIRNMMDSRTAAQGNLAGME